MSNPEQRRPPEVLQEILVTSETGDVVEAVPDSEKREKLKQQVMRDMWDLGEREIYSADFLSSLGPKKPFSRKIFLDEGGERPVLHEADELDRMADWLNEGSLRHKEELEKDPNLMETLRDELLDADEAFVEYARKSAGIADNAWKRKEKSTESVGTSKKGLTLVRSEASADLSELPEKPDSDDLKDVIEWLSKWQHDARKLAKDLYTWAKININKDLYSHELEIRRAQKELVRLGEEYSQPEVITEILRERRFWIVQFIINNYGFTRDDWSKFVASK